MGRGLRWSRGRPLLDGGSGSGFAISTNGFSRDHVIRRVAFWIFRRLVRARLGTERATLETEREYRAIFELAGSGKGQVDLGSGRFTRVNRKLCEIVGYTSEELLKLTLSELTHPEDRSADFRTYHNLLSGSI